MPHHRVHAADAEVRAPLLTGNSADTDTDEGTAAPSLNCRVILKLLNWQFYWERDEDTTLCTVIFYLLRYDIAAAVVAQTHFFNFLFPFFLESNSLIERCVTEKNEQLLRCLQLLRRFTFLQVQIADVQQLLVVFYNGSSK